VLLLDPLDPRLLADRAVSSLPRPGLAAASA